MNVVALLAALRAAVSSPVGARLTLGALALALAGGLCVWAYACGEESARLECERTAAKEKQRAGEEIARRADAGATVEQAAQVAETEREVRYRTIDREVIRYVEKRAAASAAPAATSVAGFGCALDADGLRLWSAANRGQLPAAADDAGTGLRTAAGPGLGLVLGPADQSRGDGAAAAPVPGPSWRDGALVRSGEPLAGLSE